MTFKTNRFFLYFLVIYIALLFGCNKQKQPENVELVTTNDFPIKKEEPLQIEKTKFGVVKVDRLRLRSSNDIHAKTLRYLDQGAIVEVVKSDKNRVRINELEGYWYNIRYEGINGWVFGYYLNIYPNYDYAENAATNYGQKEKEEPLKPTGDYFDKSINNNLFFLSEGRILQLLDGENGKARVLNTAESSLVRKYFPAKNSPLIYYIAQQLHSPFESHSLYSYNLTTDENSLISKNVYQCVFDFNKRAVLLLGLQKKLNNEQWLIRLFDLENGQEVRAVSRIERKEQYKKAIDTFTKTLERELGGFTLFDWERDKNFIYFKPPEENQTYLVSLANGDYIKVDIEEDNRFSINEYQELRVSSQEVDENNKPLYSVILKDKVSGVEKEIIKSPYYPVNFVPSPNKNYIAITMVTADMQEQSEYYPSSIYLFSLSTYSLIPVTTGGNSYQPAWSNVKL